MRRRSGACALLLVLATCAEEAPPPAAEQQGPEPVHRAGEVEEVAPIVLEVFLREPAEHAGHMTLHALLPAGASHEQTRQALVALLEREGQADSSLVAVRAIAYVGQAQSEREAELVPVAWAEWLPAEGWGAAPSARGAFHRTYTYTGSAPAW